MKGNHGNEKLPPHATIGIIPKRCPGKQKQGRPLMNHAIPPEVQAHIAEGVAWLWDKFGQKIVEKVVDRGVDEAKWQLGISKYYLSLFERVGFVRVLGRMESEPLENVFTHVNVLDKLSAERRYDVPKLIAEFGRVTLAGQTE